MTALDRYQAGEVTLLSDAQVQGGVTFAFTERTGGVSAGQWASLNLGSACGDDPAAVVENRRRALAAIGAEAWEGALVSPHQVHGDEFIHVSSAEPAALAEAREKGAAGADAVVCTVPHVPVMLCFADCVPVVLVAPGGFAIAHSGWRGTIARIAGKAARELARQAGRAASDVSAYIGPHVGACDYEVSDELLARFVAEFGDGADAGERHLDLAFAVRQALLDEGVSPGSIACCEDSTASNTGRFFSWRAESGQTGRHAAVAVMGSDASSSWASAPIVEGRV